ncbi:CIC11C00000002438 [Sungouiella intermedia]|uniref:low-specificity L-threonine aldolase n=1 Tax=Sungouiella intermedia TaxID=45354 RepID=A0A1L0BA88_9ASCO|nr:CIC11C00000000295 [[Candida] intermedia]SGZ52857.1 CIC11C00000002438 [[Candida] intermedia]
MTLDDFIYPTHNEFRSDTFTVPTKSMNDAVIQGLTTGTLQVGDSVYKEDPMTLQLEAKVAEMAGKEAALFCVSGTMSNQVGLRVNLVQPPYSILCDYRAHVFLHEAGGLATLSQAMVHPVVPANGNYLTLEDIVENFTPSDGDIHGAPTKVISLENTLHGMILPIEEIARILKFAKEHDIRLHLDGARLFNASVETGVSIAEYCQYFDSVSLCLSKSLGAPIGSILVGDRQFIEKANHFKKQCGGGIRQNGINALMAITALDENFNKIRLGHQYARSVGDFCRQHDIALELPVDTNFVFVDLKKNKMDDALLVALGEKHNVKLMGGRIAFHFQLSPESVDNLKQALLECKQEALRNPFVGRRCNKQMYNVAVIRQKQKLAN